MQPFTNTKKYKKLIIALVVLLLFNFCYPKTAKALELMEDLEALPAKILYALEKGILKFLNNIFTNEGYHASSTVENIESAEADGGYFIKEHLNIYLTPESIIKGKFILFDANIFKEISNDNGYYDYEDDGAVVHGKTELRKIIAGWYYALRNFAIVALLSVLVYVGIRMILSTIAQDKAKYKAMFKDWLIAVCLVVLMHYLMIAILDITSLITDAVGRDGLGSDMITNLTGDIHGILEEQYNESPIYSGYKMPVYDENHVPTGEIMTIGDAYAKILVLLGIIIYIFIFAIKYLKREFTVIFLILLGPVSCITYPIDKIADGKAQAFNKWFAEFLYNVIIQPFHLLLYIVLVGSAAELADANVIYALVCFAVMIPAEKFIKEMFGFRDKLGSPLGAFATGAVASNLINKMKGGGSSSREKDKDVESTQRELPPKQAPQYDEVAGGNRDTLGDGSNNHPEQDQNPPVRGREQTPPNNDNLDQNADGSVRERQIESGDGQDTGNDQEHLENADSSIRERQTESIDGQDTGNDQEHLENADDNENFLPPTEEDQNDYPAYSIDYGEDASDSTINSEEYETPYLQEEETPNTQNEGEALNTGDEEETTNAQNQEDEERRRNILSRIKNSRAVGQIAAIHNQRMARKWGSTNRGQRWKNRGKKLGKRGLGLLARLAKTGVRAAGTLAGAAAFGTIGLMTGQGAKGMAVGAAFGSNLSNKAIGKVEKQNQYIKNAAQDYYQGLSSNKPMDENKYSPFNKEQQAFNRFREDPRNIDAAVMSYRYRHDGEDPGYKALNEEMQERFELSRYGLNNDQIDSTMNELHALQNSGLSEEDALKQAIIEQRLADRYKGKFGKELEMMSAVQAVTKSFTDKNVPPEIAESKARELLERAGKNISRETVTLPKPKESVAPESMPVQMLRQQGNNHPTQIEIGQEEERYLQLQDAGYTDNQILRLSQIAGNDERFQVIVDRAIRVHEEWQKPKEAVLQIGIPAQSTREEVNAEFVERLSIEKEFNLNSDSENERSKIDAIREFEKKTKATVEQRSLGGRAFRGELSNNDRNSMSDKEKMIAEEYSKLASTSKVKPKKAPTTYRERARRLANEQRGNLNNEGKREVIRKKLIGEIKAEDGRVSSGRAQDVANEIINMAAETNGEGIQKSKPKPKK